MLCRRGNISRQDIGAIRIFDRETKVEIRPELAAHFAASVRTTEGAGAVLIERIDAAPHRSRPKVAAQRDGPRPRRAANEKEAQKGRRLTAAPAK